MDDKPILTKKFNEELDIDRKMSEGGVLGRIYIEVQGTDVEAAKLALDNMVNKRLVSENQIFVLQVNMYDIVKDPEAEFFSGVSEVEFLAADFRWFINMVLKYGPAAVEVIEPSELKLSSDLMHSIVADAADFAHVYSQQIMKFLKDPERRALYEKMLESEE